jgi:hypothetical protein
MSPSFNDPDFVDPELDDPELDDPELDDPDLDDSDFVDSDWISHRLSSPVSSPPSPSLGPGCGSDNAFDLPATHEPSTAKSHSSPAQRTVPSTPPTDFSDSDWNEPVLHQEAWQPAANKYPTSTSMPIIDLTQDDEMDHMASSCMKPCTAEPPCVTHATGASSLGNGPANPHPRLWSRGSAWICLVITPFIVSCR